MTLSFFQYKHPAIILVWSKNQFVYFPFGLFPYGLHPRLSPFLIILMIPKPHCNMCFMINFSNDQNSTPSLKMLRQPTFEMTTSYYNCKSSKYISFSKWKAKFNLQFLPEMLNSVNSNHKLHRHWHLAKPVGILWAKVINLKSLNWTNLFQILHSMMGDGGRNTVYE